MIAIEQEKNRPGESHEPLTETITNWTKRQMYQTNERTNSRQPNGRKKERTNERMLAQMREQSKGKEGLPFSPGAESAELTGPDESSTAQEFFNSCLPMLMTN